MISEDSILEQSGDPGSIIYLNSLRRGLRALELLNNRECLSATELAGYLQVPRTTARRILDTLALDGYAAKIPHKAKYRLTSDASALASGVTDETWIIDVASPILTERTRALGWSFIVTTQKGESMVVRIATDRLSPHAIRHTKVGTKIPMVYSASGHLMLAYMPRDERETLLNLLRKSDNVTHRASNDPEFIESLVRCTLKQGFCHVPFPNEGESVLGVPIFLDNKIRACLIMQHITAAIPKAQIVSEFVTSLKAIAQEISNKVEGLRQSNDRLPARLASPTPASEPASCGSGCEAA